MKNNNVIFTFFCLIICSCAFAFQGKDTIQKPVTNSALYSLISLAENSLVEASDLTGTANYPKAYDNLWDVLRFADSTENSTLKYKAYKQLSMLYSIFHNYSKASSCIDSMFYYASKTKEVSNKSKGNLHFSAAITHRMSKNYVEAENQLLICEQLLDSLNVPIKERLYVLTEKAHLNTLLGNYIKAEEILVEITKQIHTNHSYASIVYSMWGDLYSKMNDNNKALQYYNKSLLAIEEQNIRIGLKVDLLSKVSKINYSLGNNKIAFEQMEASKKLGDSLFGSQSESNKQLFEIKDSYRKVILENQKIQKEQELKSLKSKEERLNLQLWFLIILLIVMVLASIIIVAFLKKKHVLEKELITQRTLSEVELKKKELTLTALQLIEKDKLLGEIKDDLEKIQHGNTDASINKIKSTIQVNSKKKWEEFEARFVQINNSFYEALNKKHDNLSRNELKLCALIKLNFSSKEMADILGVSADSINKARYRLRKKLNLTRDENLVSYITAF